MERFLAPILDFLSTHPVGIFLSVLSLYTSMNALERSARISAFLRRHPFLKPSAAAVVAAIPAVMAYLIAKVPLGPVATTAFLSFSGAATINAWANRRRDASLRREPAPASTGGTK